MELAKEKRGHFLYCSFYLKDIFKHLCFISMYSVLNTLSEYTYFYISKNITSYTFLLVFKIVESLQCILEWNFIPQVISSNTVWLIAVSAKADSRKMLISSTLSKIINQRDTNLFHFHWVNNCFSRLRFHG